MKQDINNCINCGSAYEEEYWREIPIYKNNELKPPKGLCPFCNPKYKYYNK